MSHPPLINLIGYLVLALCVCTAIQSTAHGAEAKEPGSDKAKQAIDSALDADTLHIVVDEVAHYGKPDKVLWLHVSLPPAAGAKVLEVLSPNIDTIEVYHMASGQLIYSKITGEAFPFSSRAIASPHFLFPLAPIDEPSHLLVRIMSSKPASIPVYVSSPEQAFRRQNQKDIFFSIYTGVVLVMFLYNLFIWISIRDRNYLYYVIAIFFVGLTQLTLNGYGNQYFWPENPWLGLRSVPLAGILSGVASVLFAQYYLKIGTYSPKLNKVINIFFALYALALIPTIAGYFALSISIINTCGAAALLLVYAAIRSYKAGHKSALFFIVAWSFFLLGVTIYSLAGFGLLPYNAFTSYALPVGSAIEVILLSFALAHKFKRYRDDALVQLTELNQIKAVANEELEHKVYQRTKLINEQKQVLESQKEEMLASMRYAEHIQHSLLPDPQVYSAQIGESFVFFKPRDIVSGDFFWYGETTALHPWMQSEKLKLFAVVDCTGHGVPGALMSVLGHNALERSTEQAEVTCPATALDFISKEMLRTLHRDKGGAPIRDGMDMVLCAYDEANRLLYFAGAKNNLYILRNGAYHIFKGNRASIGSTFAEKAEAYQLHQIDILPGDTLYTFTDGFPDQFGMSNNKKLKSKPLLDIVKELSAYTMKEQKFLIERTFDHWRGELEQVDDVCMLGIRFS